jgi:hypothetical protein
MTGSGEKRAGGEWWVVGSGREKWRGGAGRRGRRFEICDGRRATRDQTAIPMKQKIALRAARKAVFGRSARLKQKKDLDVKPTSVASGYLFS